ncbi:ketose-bisphosphate aldolase [Oceanobacillus sojae]|uniref:Fructose-bisphosphate aldolase n=1 Tax=Oceanobacillus sojae TaxID=582851 RepID=A0A511ZGY4_9BACI|nr:ketose-bisphosphate aldolase [Oceanobacillus sojae]GEN86710.1 hypothetical protein OSO01_14490 [Oceanobacillus sojae]
MIYNMRDVLQVARKNQFAVPAFNISSLEMLKAVIKKSEELNAPVIIEIHPDELAYMGLEWMATIKEYAQGAKVPVVIHLDHGRTIDEVMKAVQAGFTSVMFDGSLMEYNQNVIETQNVVQLMKSLNISVEGELGTIGNTGNSAETSSSEIIYTNPIEAIDFVEKTNIDSFAVAIGTAHGLYPKGKRPCLNIKLLEEISSKIKIPLVLHGGSGNTDEELKKAVLLGIAKINISSDIKSAFFNQMRIVLSNNGLYEPNQIYPSCMNKVKEVVEHKMNIFNTAGKAALYG